jgi:hypothetical protein
MLDVESRINTNKGTTSYLEPKSCKLQSKRLKEPRQFRFSQFVTSA